MSRIFARLPPPGSPPAPAAAMIGCTRTYEYTRNVTKPICKSQRASLRLNSQNIRLQRVVRRSCLNVAVVSVATRRDFDEEVTAGAPVQLYGSIYGCRVPSSFGQRTQQRAQARFSHPTTRAWKIAAPCICISCIHA